MKFLAAAFLATSLLLGSVLSVQAAIFTGNVPRITKEELRPMIGNPEVIILDVRQPDDWNNSQSKIKGAVRIDPKEKLGSVMNKLPKDKTLVFYCS
jgi:rhodanese-related sulfurtransferase